jgi:hypothetical protein
MTRGPDETRIDRDLMARNNLFVACQMDDDIPYLVTYAGEEHLVIGTDYGHLDIGSDLHAHRIVTERTDLDAGVARKIVDTNARALFGIDPAFTPAPEPSLTGTRA